MSEAIKELERRGGERRKRRWSAKKKAVKEMREGGDKMNECRCWRRNG